MSNIIKKLKNGYIIVMCSGESFIVQSNKLISIWRSTVYSIDIIDTSYDLKPCKIYDGNDIIEMPKLFSECTVRPIYEEGTWV